MSADPPSLLAGGYFGLQGTVALVTGASSGLGRHFAKTLAAAGCVVGVAARRTDRLDSLVTDIAANAGQAIALEMDVTDPESVRQGIQLLNDRVGPINLLVNNAGMAVSHRFIDAQAVERDAVFALNQTAVWEVAQQICQQMIAHSCAGSIINIASVGGLRTMGGAASYSVSKAAVVQMTKVMAMELARHNIRVNALAPGYISTEINADFLDSAAGQKLVNRSPMRRIGQCEELDGALLLLASERGSFMTGVALPVDGGHLVSSL